MGETHQQGVDYRHMHADIFEYGGFWTPQFGKCLGPKTHCRPMQLGLHSLGGADAVGIGQCQVGLGFLLHCPGFSRSGLFVFWTEPIFLGLGGQFARHFVLLDLGFLGGLQVLGGLFNRENSSFNTY
jgi:hypothetical protein